MNVEDSIALYMIFENKDILKRYIYAIYLLKNTWDMKNNRRNEFYTPNLVGLEVLHVQIQQFLRNNDFQDGRRRHLDLRKSQDGDC